MAPALQNKTQQTQPEQEQGNQRAASMFMIREIPRSPIFETSAGNNNNKDVATGMSREV